MRFRDQNGPLHHPIFKPANFPDFLTVARTANRFFLIDVVSLSIAPVSCYLFDKYKLRPGINLARKLLLGSNRNRREFRRMFDQIREPSFSVLGYGVVVQNGAYPKPEHMIGLPDRSLR